MFLEESSGFLTNSRKNGLAKWHCQFVRVWHSIVQVENDADLFERDVPRQCPTIRFFHFRYERMSSNEALLG